MSIYQPSGAGGDSQSLGDLIRALFQEFSELIQQHIELGKTELKEDATHWSQTAVMFFSGALLAHIFALFLGIAGMFALGGVMPFWGAALIVSAVYLAGAFVFFKTGQKLLKDMKH